MHRFLVFGLALMVSATSASGGELDPALRGILEQRPADAVVSTLVYLHEQADLAALDRFVATGPRNLGWRHEVVVRELQAIATTTQSDLLVELQRLTDEQRVVEYRGYWIGNIVRVAASRAAIEVIAARPEVDRVYYDFEIPDPDPAVRGGGVTPAAEGGVEPGVAAVRAPDVWALGITGEGTIVATLDTGVDSHHPALGARWRGLDPLYAGNPGWAWFDPITGTITPEAFNDHGTHTMGSVCGGAPGNQIGVAPGAQWIHAAVFTSNTPQFVSGVIESFQWMIDPDGDPATSFDVPDTCSNSWGLLDVHGMPACDETFWTFIDACEVAGIVMIFSAGNEGTLGLRRPADRATDEFRSFAVGAVDGNNPAYPIWASSSRGPTNCTPSGEQAIKPDISAPGVNVISSLPGGGYGALTGTSMAAPHVNGVVALMRQADPDLSVDQIKQIIYDTALDLGPPREDNDYGWGMIDAYAAVQAVLQPPCPADLDGDNEVGIIDFLDLLAAWGPNPGHPADLDGDDVVGINDFLALLAAWGPCP